MLPFSRFLYLAIEPSRHHLPQLQVVLIPEKRRSLPSSRQLKCLQGGRMAMAVAEQLSANRLQERIFATSIKRISHIESKTPLVSSSSLGHELNDSMRPFSQGQPRSQELASRGEANFLDTFCSKLLQVYVCGLSTHHRLLGLDEFIDTHRCFKAFK